MPVGLILAASGAVAAVLRKMEGKDRWNVVSTIVILLTCILLKDSFKYSAPMKENMAKHYHMFTCMYAKHIKHRGLYKYEDDDLFVLSFGRSGTMLTMNIFHQLRTGGDPDFDDIMFVGRHFTPGTGNELINDKQRGAPPRLYFSHGLTWHVPRTDGQRFVYIQRRFEDVGVSWRQFARDFYTLEQEIPLEEFFFECVVRGCAIPQDHWFTHVAGWWQFRNNNPQIDFGWFHFERTAPSEYLTEAVEGAAKFLHKPLDNSTRAKVLDYISVDFVRKNQKKFDIHTLKEDHISTINECINMPHMKMDISNTGVNSMRRTVEKNKGQKPIIPDSVKTLIERKWALRVEPFTGYKNYEQMLQHYAEHRWSPPAQ